MSTDDHVSFSKPKIGPKVYLACGPSGWSQTFPRAAADKELAAFVHPVQVPVLIELFNATRETTQTPADWHTVIGFLARTMQTHPNAVPATVGVAFWAQCILAIASKGTN